MTDLSTTTHPLTCQELVELVTSYLEGTLAPGERARFETHLAGCRGCEAYLAQVRKTIRVTGTTLTAETIPDGVRDQLLAAFRAWKRG